MELTSVRMLLTDVHITVVRRRRSVLLLRECVAPQQKKTSEKTYYRYYFYFVVREFYTKLPICTGVYEQFDIEVKVFFLN